MKYAELAQKIVELLGGKSNIRQATHCATRLRFIVKEESAIQEQALRQLPGVLEVNQRMGEIQVVIGNEVQNVYYAVNKLVGDSESTTVKEKKGNRLSRIIDTIAGIFTPILPALCGCAMLQAVLVILTTLNWVATDSTTYQIINYCSNVIFYFLPMLLAFTSAKKFNCNPYVAVILAGCLLHPDFIAMTSAGTPITLFGLPVTAASYSSSVLPIIIAVWIMSYVERFADRVTPSFVKYFIKPLITLLIMIPLTLVIIGPAGAIGGNYLAMLVAWLQEQAGWLVTIIMSVIAPLIVITGMHYALFPLVFQSLASLGYVVLMGVTGLTTNLGQGGACFAVALKTRNKEFRQLAVSAGLTACFGISEPALYGVTLKLKRPFWAVLASGLTGGIVAVVTSLKAYTFLSPGLMAFPGFIAGGTSNMLAFLACCVISFATAFILTWVLGFEDVIENSASSEEMPAPATSSNVISAVEETILTPVSGQVVTLSTVQDKIFSEEILGPGLAIQPQDGQVYAPADGTITALFETRHAIGITTETGLEILIHLGLDTVNLKGEGFENKVAKGEKVKAGQLLATMDLARLTALGYDMITPVVITNGEQAQIERLANEKAQAQTPLFRVKRGLSNA